VSESADHQLDTRGLFCPEPVMLLHNKIRDAAAGELLEVLATDPSTTRDIPRFCTFLGHELLQQEQNNKEYRYLIRKQAP
jgi:tRNA 2-thiouridine synthesizing protein A